MRAVAPCGRGQELREGMRGKVQASEIGILIGGKRRRLKIYCGTNRRDDYATVEHRSQAMHR
jgi:hypothetical protein